jgi:hypothetical protein
MLQYFEKKTSNIPGDNGSSLNIPITTKIIALANITLIYINYYLKAAALLLNVLERQKVSS